MILADKIILERKKNGWSQEELANKLGVTRQAVSKWEGAQTTPDLQRILEMSKLFGVTIDYLMKDEIDSEECMVAVEEENPSVRRVSMDEANKFLSIKRKTAPQIAMGILLCIISPIAMFLLGAGAEENLIPLSEDAAGGIGMMIVLMMVAVASAIFIQCGMKTKPYEFLENELIETEYGVTGMVKERKHQYEGTYTKYNIVGTVLCMTGAMALFGSCIVGENEFIQTVCLCIMFALVALGVRFFVIAGINQASFEKLLQEGDYSVKEKTKSSLRGGISTIYWLLVTAAFLVIGFADDEWQYAGLIWPVAAVIYPAIMVFVNMLEKDKENK